MCIRDSSYSTSSSLSCLPAFPRYRLSAPFCPASYSTPLAPSSARAPRSSLIAGAVRRCSFSAVPRGSLAALLPTGSLRSGSVWGQCRRWRWLSPARLRLPLRARLRDLAGSLQARAPRASRQVLRHLRRRFVRGIIDDALKAVQAERNVETIISARSAQRIGCVGGKVRWKISSH